MKLKKKKQTITIKEKATKKKGFNFEYLLKEHRAYKSKDSIKTACLVNRLKARGFKEAYIDLKMLAPLVILGFIIVLFMVW